MRRKPTAQLRITVESLKSLEALIFSRYPHLEWGTFFFFGFRELDEQLVITYVSSQAPETGDMAENVPNVKFLEPYSVRTALAVRSTPLCVGVVHSHPRTFIPLPSTIDDEMDAYFQDYFSGFTKEPCYASLIFSKSDKNELEFSGRICFKGKWFILDEMITIGDTEIQKSKAYGFPSTVFESPFTERFKTVYGQRSESRLQNSKVTVVGCSGTGSPTLHSLARAGVGEFILIDPQRAEKSNTERIHGLFPHHFDIKPSPYKVEIARDLILSINPRAKVTMIVGNILDPIARDHAIPSDILINCTDSVHSRAAVSELAYRYLLPVLDVGVLPTGEDGKITSEVTQVIKYSPNLPCARCLSQINSRLIELELMTDEEKAKRKALAVEALERGEKPEGYWEDVPQIHTVGHLTSMAGALVSGYAIGWLTGCFSMPANYFQFDFLATKFNYVSIDIDKRVDCYCNKNVGFSDQGARWSLLEAPSHWPKAKVI